MVKKAAVVKIAFILLVALISLYFSLKYFSEEEYRSFMSPQGHYVVTVFRTPVFPSIMPGQSGDAPGVVKLFDYKGKVLQKTKVEMVQLVDTVEWETNKVRIKNVVEWNLPEPDEKVIPSGKPRS